MSKSNPKHQWMMLFWAVLPVCASYLSPHDPADLGKVFNYPQNVLRIPGGGNRCPIHSGSPNCKSAIRCSPWFIDLLHNPWWCHAADGSFGACCPDVTTTTSTVARFPEFSKLTAMPYDVPQSDIDAIVMESFHIIRDIASYEKREWDEMLAPWQDSAAFSYSATTRGHHLAQTEGWKGLQLAEATRKLASLLRLSPKEAGFVTQNVPVNNTDLQDICRKAPVCEDVLYRSFDGSCNNREHPNWGRSNSETERILPPQYHDGIWAPREWPGLPTVDEVSESIKDNDVPDNQLTITVMHWGQLVAHDLSHTPTYRTIRGEAIRCCTPDGKYLSSEQTHPLCFPIDVSAENEFYSAHGVSCQEFIRSVIAPREDCNFGYANQLNQNTAHLDASVVYGSTEEVARSLREFDGGRLRVTVIGGDYHLLPIDPARRDCIGDGKGCFTAGDHRVNQYTALTVMHIIFVRLHNRYATDIARINPHWDDERLFQETRKIIGALMQHITYNEYLPSVLGPNVMTEYGLLPQTSGYVKTYDPEVKVQVTNEFSTAAFRYGHSVIRNSNELWMDDAYSVYGGELFLKDWFNNPSILNQPAVLNAMIRHFITGSAQNFDYNVAEAVHRYLFKSPSQKFGLDLISANLWRGRDHGLPGYNFYLESCGIKRAKNFNDLRPIIRPDVIERFAKMYESVDDIDLYAGMLGEWAVEGGLVGPVTSCIMADQFKRLKDGDRFFYENGDMGHSFSPDQLDSIRSMSFARVLCDTSDSVAWTTYSVFWIPSEVNPWLPCHGKDIPHLNLEAWRDESFQES